MSGGTDLIVSKQGGITVDEADSRVFFLEISMNMFFEPVLGILAPLDGTSSLRSHREDFSAVS